MTSSQKIDLLLLVSFLVTVDVQSLNYYYAGPHPRFLPRPEESVPLPVAEPTTSDPNGTITEISIQRGIPYTIFYPLTFPQSRGGRTLNLTLVSKSSTADKIQPRILNRPELYPYFAIPRPVLAGSSHASPPLKRFDDAKRVQYKIKIPNENYKNDSFNPPSDKLLNVETDFALQPQRLREADAINKNLELSRVVNKNFRQSDINFKQSDEIKNLGQPGIDNKSARQPKVERFSPPAQNYKLPNVSPFPQKASKTPGTRYQVPSKLYQKIVLGQGHQGSAQNWPCFCVPYYLCKDGFINSGGRSVAALNRKTRSLKYISLDNFRNKTNSQPPVQPKVMNAYVVEAVSEPHLCDGNKVCCRPSFEDDTADDNHYPVATPPPDPYYPDPPRFPDISRGSDVCGIRRAYGIQGRLKQLQYSADVAEFAEYPWQVAVLRKVEGKKSVYLCGGVLISQQWVATAAHCVQREEFSPLLIRLGEWDVNRKDEVYPYVEEDVDAVVLHPEFVPETLFNDLALIRMRSPVDPRIPHVTPACLPSRGVVYENEKCWVSGWGKDFFGPQGEYQNVLKEVDVPVIGRGLCNEQLRRTNLGSDFTLHPGFLCAGGEAGKDACTGDGGSPLVCRSGPTWYVVGLVSWGIGCGRPGVPGIYVNILRYIDWINTMIWR